jgi:hypothetical protein
MARGLLYVLHIRSFVPSLFWLFVVSSLSKISLFCSLRFSRKGTAKIRRFFQSAKFSSKNFQTFFSAPPPRAPFLSESGCKDSAICKQNKENAVFFQKKLRKGGKARLKPLCATFRETEMFQFCYKAACLHEQSEGIANRMPHEVPTALSKDSCRLRSFATLRMTA